MDMSNENMVLCASNAYNRKYYLNEHFNGLPESIKEELVILDTFWEENFQLVLSAHLQ